MSSLPSYMESYSDEEFNEYWGDEIIDDEPIEYNKEFENE